MPEHHIVLQFRPNCKVNSPKLKTNFAQFAEQFGRNWFSRRCQLLFHTLSNMLTMRSAERPSQRSGMAHGLRSPATIASTA